MLNGVICGWGYSGKSIHSHLFSKTNGIALYGIVTSQSVSGSFKTFSHLSDALADPSVSFVVICNTTEAHYSDTMASLKAGKHVIVDKPMCITVSEAKEMIELAKKMKLVLAVFHNRRFDGDFLTVKNLISENKLSLLTF